MNTPATPSTRSQPSFIRRRPLAGARHRRADRRMCARAARSRAQGRRVHPHAGLGARRMRASAPLARDAEVSVATVTRFAKAVGCRDVRELKVLVAQAAAVGQRWCRPTTRRPTIRPRVDGLEIRVALAHNHRCCATRRSRQPPPARRREDDLRVRGRRLDRARRRVALPARAFRPAGREDSVLQRMVAATLSRATPSSSRCR